MKLFRYLLISSVVGCSLFALFVSTTNAATVASPAQGENVTSANIVASLSIYNAKIVSQSGSNLKISFDLFNEDKIQPQVKYSVSLTSKTKTGNLLEDEKLYSEVVSVGEGETVSKTIDYTAPSYLRGEYKVWIKAMNESSLLLGITTAGNVTLAGTGEFVQIKAETCYLTISGETTEKYNLSQGVDVASSEKLFINCELKNNFKVSKIVTPSFNVFWHTAYGELIQSAKGEPITLNASESKTVKLEVPVPKNPQAYDAVFSLVDSSGVSLSNTVKIHYVVRGVSATIQNVRLDKDRYSKGETAKLSLDWSPSADIFPDSRAGGSGSNISAITTEITIKGSDGSNCSNPVSKQMEKSAVLDIPIIADCLNPTVSVSLKDSNGAILATSTFNVETKTKASKQEVTDKAATKNKSILVSVFVILVLVVVIIAILIFRKRGLNKINSVPPVVMFLIICGMLLFGNTASAHTFLVDATVHGNMYVWTRYTVQLNKSVVDPGETIKATGHGEGGYCANSWSGMTLYAVLPDGSKPHLISIPGRQDVGPVSGDGSTTFSAPTTPGNYIVKFCGDVVSAAWGCHDEYFRVRGCGNGVLETGETCDKGANNGCTNGGTCSTSCQPCSVCGDGKKEGPEECDLGTSNGTCPSTCSSECKTNAECPCVTNCGGGGVGTSCTTNANCDAGLCCSESNVCAANCKGNEGQCGAAVAGKICCSDKTWRTDCACALEPSNANQKCCTVDGIWREKCTGCTKDSQCATSRAECCSEEYGTCTTDQTYCVDADFRIDQADDIVIYLTANQEDHIGSTRVKVTTEGGFHKDITLSPVSTSPDDNLKNKMLNWSGDMFNPNPLTSDKYKQGSMVTVKVPYNIIPAGTSKTYEMVIKGVANAIERTRAIKVKIYGQGWVQP